MKPKVVFAVTQNAKFITKELMVYLFNNWLNIIIPPSAMQHVILVKHARCYFFAK